jgi:hypothetical protein
MDIFLANLTKDIAIASGGQLSPREVVEFLKRDFDPDQLRYNDGKVRIGYRSYTIRIGGTALRKWDFRGYEYREALERVEDVVRSLDLQDMMRGEHIERLRRRY